MGILVGRHASACAQQLGKARPMRRRYFFFDIDGTLIPGTGYHDVPDNTRAALDQLKANGNFLAIATGRAHCLAVEDMHAMGFSNMVSDGGYGVTLDGRLLGIEPMDRDLCIELAAECDARGIPWGCGIEDDKVRLTRTQRFCDLTNDHYQVARVVPDLDLSKEPVILRMFVAIPSGEEESLPALRSLPWVRYDDSCYIYVEPADKARGIRRIMREFDCTDEDIVVFGDGKNDLSMFMPEWTCIAMGNGKPELKAKADYVTRDSDDDGIGYALRHFGWI